MRRQQEMIHKPEGKDPMQVETPAMTPRIFPAKRMVGLCAALLTGILATASVARAQDSGSVPPPASPTGAPPAGPTGGGPPGGPQMAPPPLPVLLGYANFMLTLERPWQAEKLYKLILMLDPKNVAAQKGLEDAENMKHIGFATLVHSYYDSKDVQSLGYGGGPIIMMPSGKMTFTFGNGYYKNNNNPNNRRNPTTQLPTFPSPYDNFALQRQTYNLEYTPFWGKKMENEAAIWLSYQHYDDVPSKLLYDINYTYNIKPGREKINIGTGRKNSFYSSQLNQFLAPETYFELQKGITFNDYYAEVAYPMAPQWDLDFRYRFFDYSDGNQRNNFRTQFLYRIMPTDPRKQMPIWRVGLDGIVDLGRFFTFDYGIPRDFRSVSVMTDYAILGRATKFVLYASYPIAEKNFAAPAGLVAYASQAFGPAKRFEFYSKAEILEARNLSVSLYDYVSGLNIRF